MRGLSTATREQPPLTVTREEARAAAKHNHKKFFSKMDPIYWHHLWAGQLPLLGSKFPEKEQVWVSLSTSSPAELVAQIFETHEGINDQIKS